MKSEDIRVTELLEGPTHFIAPVFQVDHSWGTTPCLQLRKDIVRVGSDEKAQAHFVGSVVYFSVIDAAHISSAMHIGRQAYERVSE